jgi:steroid 5-alpha reductase family enzyme
LEFTNLNKLGLILITIGFFWEAISDYQLNSFKKDLGNKNKFLKSGLWSLSRHPNYFGEILFWWGIFVFSIVNYFSLFAVLGPLVFTYLIINVTGVKTLDKRMAKNYDGYSAYIDNTNPILPKFF